MLWFKLLQNTIYCGTLQFTSCQCYRWGSFVTHRQPAERERAKQTVLPLFCVFCKFTADTTPVVTNLQQVHIQEEG